jgi:hypothetical protein
MTTSRAMAIGEAVKDGYKQTDNWAHHGIKWLEEIQEYYRERATMEKEYGTKLQQLSKKYRMDDTCFENRLTCRGETSQEICGVERGRYAGHDSRIA